MVQCMAITDMAGLITVSESGVGVAEDCLKNPKRQGTSTTAASLALRV